MSAASLKSSLKRSDLCGDWYDRCTNIPERNWFGVWDCLQRWLLCVVAFYFYMFTCPIDFFRTYCAYYTTWYGNFHGGLFILFYPCYPIYVVITVLLTDLQKTLKSLLSSKEAKDWKSAGAGAVFFIRPENYLGAILWDSYVEMSMYNAFGMAIGYDADAVQASWHDIYTTKIFWRKIFDENDIRAPRELGHWSGKNFEKKYELDCDMVIKVDDSYLGIGDTFLTYGKDYQKEDEITQILKTDYDGKESLLLEFVQADPDLGVHSFDIITFMTDDGPKILSCLLWCHCEGPSSHGTTGGYVIDVETETCISTLNWYCAAFKDQRRDYVLEKRKIPGVKLACEQALRAHKNIPFGWLKMIGWDCMLTNKGEMVFFEGNFAAARLPRRIFLSTGNLWSCMTRHFWPFSYNPFV